MHYINSVVKIASKFLIVAILGITVGCVSQGTPASDTDTVTADTDPATADTRALAVSAAEEESEIRICRTMKPTGSRFGKRVCMTQEQWTDIADTSRGALEKLQRNTNPGNASGG